MRCNTLSAVLWLAAVAAPATAALAEANVPLAWKIKGEPTCLFAPVAGEKHVYWPNNEALWCVEPRTGAVVWKHPFETNIDRPLPVRGGVLVPELGGTVHFLDLGGKERWTRDVESDRPCIAAADDRIVVVDQAGWAQCWGPGGDMVWRRQLGGATAWNPLLAQDKVFLTTTKGIFCLRSKDGSVVWHYPHDSSDETPHFPFDMALVGDELVVPFAECVVVLNAQNGRRTQWWRIVEGLNARSPVAGAVINGKGVVVIASQKMLYVKRLDFEGQTVWRADLQADRCAGSPVVRGDLIYCAVHAFGQDGPWEATRFVGFRTSDGRPMASVRLPGEVVGATLWEGDLVVSTFPGGLHRLATGKPK